MTKKKKKTRSARRCIWRYRFQAGVWNCQILNQVVKSQLFISLWNRYNQWLSDIKLNQISAFSASYFRINPCFTTGKQIGVWNCHATHRHRKTTILTSIVYEQPFLFIVSFTGYSSVQKFEMCTRLLLKICCSGYNVLGEQASRLFQGLEH